MTLSAEITPGDQPGFDAWKQCCLAGLDDRPYDHGRGVRGEYELLLELHRATNASTLYKLPPTRYGGRRLEALHGGRSQATEDDRQETRASACTHLANLEASIDLRTVLPPCLGAQLEGRAAAFPIHPTAFLGPLLATVGSVAGHRVSVFVKTGWEEPLVIWCGNVLPPGVLKSPAAGVFGGPLNQLQAESFEAHAVEIKGKGKEQADRLSARRWMVRDTTIERLGEILAQQNTYGILCYQDELAQWFAGLERTNGAAARASWLSLWNGDPVLVDRKVSNSSYARRTAVSLFGNVQPERLRSMIEAAGNDPTTAGDGLWSRFLWCRPPVIPWRYVEDGCCIREEILALLRRLDTVPAGTVLRFNRDAISCSMPLWERWADEAMSGSNPARAAFLSKLRGYSVRIAGILHMLDCAERLASPAVV